ncbi:POT family proton-dependent oligopeptide transporter [Capronia epimyces CBS 606.96]|uniref:POT family proton-dependent oligopeptide transporter n=1 Tax=Capronia epimyces CBS 606.96 TaxID=1182542 RepID=W9YD44_9EURO|nr:POT family proton-dependent oligopeptide transporter [Capronia epimyces CBS 606.96]EXJ87585.1 POT family proton-dependent oligopeptide transporter [Capronia epimyces CBS 606.96]
MVDTFLLPTEEELDTLPRVADKIPWRVYTVAFVELCERFSYYGTQILFQNFVQRKLLTPTGRAPNPGGDTDNNPGALGQGQQIATGLGTFFSFWCYALPLLGAWLADTYLGRYNTIMVSIACAILGHVILTISAVPSVLENTNGALVAFVVAIIIFGLGTGGFKPNISPLIAEQIGGEELRIATNKRGERVIVDPAQTSARIYNWFYLFINIGALAGQLSMSYAALYVGYYLAFLLPTVMFLLCPLVLIVCKKHYRLTPPQGSVLGPAIKLLCYATRGRWSLNPIRTIHNLRSATFWEEVKPSHMAPGRRPKWMTFDDAWVDEVRRGFKACTVFLWYPLYWITYNQINNNLTSQADTMRHAGVPPEIVSNLDPLTLIVLIPVCDLLVYPALRRAGVKLTPIKKITLGFWTGSAAMVYACVLQHYIYTHNECGRYPSEGRADGSECAPASVSIWAQTGIYVLIAISEILASITSLEYAFTKAPRNMRSMVQAFALFMTALANAIGEALIAWSTDPLLVWNYAATAVIAFVAGCLFWRAHRHLDSEEDALNQLPTGHVRVRRVGAVAAPVPASAPAPYARLSRTRSISNLSEASAGSEDEMLPSR